MQIRYDLATVLNGLAVSYNAFTVSEYDPTHSLAL